MLTNHDKSACSEWNQNLRSSYPLWPVLRLRPNLMTMALGHSSTCWADLWSAAEVLSRTGNACSFGHGFEVWWTFRSVKGYTFPKDPKGMWPYVAKVEDTASIYHNLPLLHRPRLRQNRLSDKIIRWVSEQVWDSVGYADIIRYSLGLPWTS